MSTQPNVTNSNRPDTTERLYVIADGLEDANAKAWRTAARELRETLYSIVDVLRSMNAGARNPDVILCSNAIGSMGVHQLYDEALDVIGTMINADNRRSSLLSVAHHQIRHGDLEEARHLLEQMPPQRDVSAALAEVDIRSGRKEEGLKRLHGVRDKVRYLPNIIYTLLEQDEVAFALSLIPDRPSSKFYDSLYISRISQILWRSGNLNGLKDLLDRTQNAPIRDDKREETLGYFARALVQADEPLQAEEILYGIKSCNNARNSIVRSLVGYYSAHGQDHKAEQFRPILNKHYPEVVQQETYRVRVNQGDLDVLLEDALASKNTGQLWTLANKFLELGEHEKALSIADSDCCQWCPPMLYVVVNAVAGAFAQQKRYTALLELQRKQGKAAGFFDAVLPGCDIQAPFDAFFALDSIHSGASYHNRLLIAARRGQLGDTVAAGNNIRWLKNQIIPDPETIKTLRRQEATGLLESVCRLLRAALDSGLADAPPVVPQDD